MSGDGVVVGVDIGGTKVLAGVVDAGGQVRRTAGRTTPGRRVDVHLVEDAVVQAVLEAANEHPIEAVGVAAAGFVDAAQRSVLFAPHLPWRGEDVRSRLADRWQAPVVLDNDANAAAWAEWTFGAARGADTALMISPQKERGSVARWSSTAVFIADATAWPASSATCRLFPAGWRVNVAARVAGSSTPAEMRWCGTYATASTARSPRWRTAARVIRWQSPAPWSPKQHEPATGLRLTRSQSSGEWLGVGLANLVAALDPDRIVIGGGVVDAGDLLLEPARITLARSLVGAEHRSVPEIVAAQLGPAAGMVGAAAMARVVAPARRARWTVSALKLNCPTAATQAGSSPLEQDPLRPEIRRPTVRVGRVMPSTRDDRSWPGLPRSRSGPRWWGGRLGRSRARPTPAVHRSRRPKTLSGRETSGGWVAGSAARMAPALAPTTPARCGRVRECPAGAVEARVRAQVASTRPPPLADRRSWRQCRPRRASSSGDCAALTGWPAHRRRGR